MYVDIVISNIFNSNKHFFFFFLFLWWIVWTSFFSCRLCSFPHSRLSYYHLRLFFLSYLILTVPMRECLGKHLCMSSPLTIAILSGTFIFREATWSKWSKCLLSKTNYNNNMTVLKCLMHECWSIVMSSRVMYFVVPRNNSSLQLNQHNILLACTSINKVTKNYRLLE